MITLVAVLIIGTILGITYVEIDRQEIQRKQEALEKEAEILKAKKEKINYQEYLNNIGKAEV